MFLYKNDLHYIHLYTKFSRYFFFAEPLEDREVTRGEGWRAEEGDFVVFEVLLVGVSTERVVELAREADLSKARIFSKACFSSVSA